MTQDEANAMALIILLGVVFSVIRNAINDRLSKYNDSRQSPAGPILHKSQALAQSREGSDRILLRGGDSEHDIDLIRRIDPSFDVNQFLDGARLVYETIVMAFAKGDRDLLRDLAADDVYDDFVKVIAAREQRRERVELKIICIRNAELAKVQLFNKQAQVTFVFSAQLVMATRAEDGAVVDGDPSKVSDVHDLWTFACDLGSKNPVWKLIATDTV